LREQRLYVIADDQNVLAIYDLQGQRVGSIALSDAVLPAEPRARKAAKPDYECLLQLPEGSLLALGSGSTPQRMSGALIRFQGAHPHVEHVELTPLYAALARELPELNIEGGCVLGDRLHLCCRGNGARHENALITLDWQLAWRDLERDHALNPQALCQVSRVALGELSGTPLSLTDLTVLGEQLWFSAAAEASASTYDDGACAGSVLGSLSADAAVGELYALSPRAKIEGICALAGERAFYAVSDADDPTSFSPLFRVDLRWHSRSK
jgi:hypothetical protein